MCLRNVPDVIIGTIASHTNEQKKGEQQHLAPHGADRSGGYPPRQFIAFRFRVPGSEFRVSDFAKASSDRPISGAGFSHAVVACVGGTL